MAVEDGRCGCGTGMDDAKYNDQIMDPAVPRGAIIDSNFFLVLLIVLWGARGGRSTARVFQKGVGEGSAYVWLVLWRREEMCRYEVMGGAYFDPHPCHRGRWFVCV